MAKYINTTKLRIVVSTKQGIINFNPGETLIVDSFISSLDPYLVDDTLPKTKLVMVEEIDEKNPTVEKPIKKVYKKKG